MIEFGGVGSTGKIPSELLLGVGIRKSKNQSLNESRRAGTLTFL
jgi:hypothetical protein